MITLKNKNVIEGGVDVQMIDADRNLVIGPRGKMISIIGLSDMVVIDTPDGLLVTKLDQTHKVKDLYKKLDRYHKEYTE